MKGLCVVLFISMSLAAFGEAGALCVKVEKANVRVGPGTKYAVGWTIYRYFPLKKVGVSLTGDWYAVEDIDGDVFWVHRTLVTAAYRCAAIDCDSANIRTGPGTRYRRLFSAPAQAYDSFRVMGSRGVWIKVKDTDGHIGWVHRKCVKVR
jgi:SH3-like domain-containing protein